jgi:O-antigen ligase
LPVASLLAILRLDVLYGGPLDSPLGYSNATAAFFVLATAAALMVGERQHGLRPAMTALAVAFATVPLLNGSTAGALLVLLLAAAPVAGAHRAGARWVIGLGGLGVLAALVVVCSIGLSYSPVQRGSSSAWGIIEATLSERRAAVWHDALVLLDHAPLYGVGPGRFSAESPTARSDRDVEAAHNALLQIGAETGWPGLLLGMSLFAWAFIRLWHSPRDGGTAVAALALTAVGVHASIDYVLHFPAVGIAVGSLVGAGSATPVRQLRPQRQITSR